MLPVVLLILFFYLGMFLCGVTTGGFWGINDSSFARWFENLPFLLQLFVLGPIAVAIFLGLVWLSDEDRPWNGLH